MKDTLPSLGYTPPGTKLVTLDRAAMSATGVFATTAMDRVGDVLDVNGIITDHHRRNPISLWNHGKEFSIPIGVTESPERVYTVEIDPEAGEARCTTYFSKHLLEAEQIYQLIDEGVIRAMSIGYRPLMAKRLAPRQGSLQRPGLHLQKVELLEVSFVAVPANQEAVRACLDRHLICGKSLAPAIRLALKPFAHSSTLRRGFIMKSAKTAVKTAAKAGAKGVVNGKADPTAEPVEVTPAVPVEPELETVDSELAEGETAKMPLGAEMLTLAHDHLLQFIEYCQAEGGALENEAVTAFLLGMVDDTFTKLTEIEALFKSEYPDLDEIPAAKKPETVSENGGGNGGEATGDANGEAKRKQDEAENGNGNGNGKPDEESKGKSYSGSAKRFTKAATSTIRECSETLDEMSGAENLDKNQKIVCRYYARALGDMVTEPEPEVGTAAEPGADPDEGLTPAQKAMALRKIKRLELLVAHKKRLAKAKALKR